MAESVRRLIIILPDQLTLDSAAFEGFDRRTDGVWMAELRTELEHVWSSKARIALFLSAMRHFRARLEGEDYRVIYRSLDAGDRDDSLGHALQRAIEPLGPERLIVVKPGAWRVENAIETTANEMDVPLEVRPDHHFLCPLDRFEEHVAERDRLVMEYFYRAMRRSTGVLMDDEKPTGGQWNYDAQNREHFGRDGPQDIAPPQSFPPDEITQNVIDLVNEAFTDHPGNLTHFDWPVTPEEAEQALGDFIAHRLPRFGPYEDAMWADEPFLYHSRISSTLNLKLLDPRKAIYAAERAYREENAPINSVEGYVRQILGWREYVRGIYWHFMPEYAERNALHAEHPLPDFYWTGETDMGCLRQCIRQTLDYGFAHHIQRLMVTGLFALLLGVEPEQVHEWYLAVYVDAIEWVELPNTVGMSQFADGGVMATKPYCASGKYINRMSNYCGDCRYDPDLRLGQDACPFTTLYWDFLMRHRERLQSNRRMALQLHNLDRIDAEEQHQIAARADEIREDVA